MTKFIMVMGIAGAGKSTLALNLAPKIGAVVLSSDAIRKELFGSETVQDNPGLVFQIMEDRTLDCLDNGTSVIYDATNLVAQRRKDLLTKIPESVRRECVLVNTPLLKALNNNQQRWRHVPTSVIRQQADILEYPTMEEGWDTVAVV